MHSLSLSLLCQPTSRLLHFLPLFQICDSKRFRKVQHQYIQKKVAVLCSFHQGDLVSRKWDGRGAEDMLQTEIVCSKETPRPQDPYNHLDDTWLSSCFRSRISDSSHIKTKSAVGGVAVQYMFDPSRSNWDGVRSGSIFCMWQQVERCMFCPPSRQAWAGCVSLVCTVLARLLFPQAGIEIPEGETIILFTESWWFT